MPDSDEFSELPEDGDYGLVMPFVVVTSKGGPYDDKSFVAGMRLQQLWSILEEKQPASYQQYINAELVPQCDLVAMHFGYVTHAEPWDEDPSWVLVKFIRNISVI
jgi:hypothetical protein